MKFAHIPVSPARILCLMAALGCWLGMAGALAAQNLPRTPYQHRALYLYNFAKFTDWPRTNFPNGQAPFVLGILGTDPFGSDIDILKSKSVKNRKLVVKYFTRVEEVENCQLLFISASETHRLAAVLERLSHQPILTVTEVENWVSARGMINLVVEDKFLAFEIDQLAVEKAGLKLDTQLLRLARNINHRKEGPL